MSEKAVDFAVIQDVLGEEETRLLEKLTLQHGLDVETWGELVGTTKEVVTDKSGLAMQKFVMKFAKESANPKATCQKIRQVYIREPDLCEIGDCFNDPKYHAGYPPATVFTEVNYMRPVPELASVPKKLGPDDTCRLTLAGVLADVTPPPKAKNAALAAATPAAPESAPLGESQRKPTRNLLDGLLNPELRRQVIEKLKGNRPLARK
jgi:hypothetical protein